MKKLLLILFAGLLLTQCVPFEKEILTEINMDIQDRQLQKIYTFQDQRLADSLYQYFWHIDPSYRLPAAMAFGSLRDSTALDSLAALLEDPIDEVRAAAAFAIGQIGSKKGELLLFKSFDQTDSVGLANVAILEAVGKCGTQKSLEALAGISTYTPKDTNLLIGQAYGLYRFALREMTTKEGTQHMIKLVTDDDYPTLPRLIAAHYLARTKELNYNLSEDGADLVVAFTKEEDDNVRMALATVVGKTQSEAAKEALLGLLGAEQNHLVKCNMIKALSNFKYEEVKEAITKTLKNPNVNVATTAAQFFLDHGVPQEARSYQRIARDTFPWQVQMKLNAASIRHMPAYMEETRGYVNYRIRRQFEASSNPYEKAAALLALGEFPWNYRYIGEKGLLSDFPVVRTAAIQALSIICKPENFNKYFGEGNRKVRKDILANLTEGIKNGDPGVIAEAAPILRQKHLNFNELIDSLNFLQAALNKLKLPAQIETYNALNETIHKLNYEAGFKPKTPDMNNPIKWETLSGIKEDSKATIRSKKGNIVIQLFPNEAPGSVANFVRLARERFYNNKNFHRVVPNFVIQGGGNRGDGYGALDFSIRTENSMLHYDDGGYVGMASAGDDTEGTQFFITHSPTPHLDGRYTIFGKVTKGMNVVNNIQQGDLIEKIEIDF